MDRTLLVGLDAACWEYLQPVLDAARMPTLQQLLDTGSWGTMQSTMPPWTPTAWASIITGKNPGKHGVYDMLWRRPGTYEFTPTNALSRRGTPFWKYLNRQGIRVGLVNVPFTYPLDDIDGFTVCGFGTPNSVPDPAFPEDALSWIRQRYPDFKPEVDSTFLQTAPPERILNEEIDHQARNVEIATSLANRYQVDFLAINLMLTDHANHKMPLMEQLRKAYELSDSHLMRLIDAFKPDHILLISDHGSSRLKGDFLLNAWLRDHGYYVQTDNNPGERRDALNWILLQWLQNRFALKGKPEKALRLLIRELSLKSPNWFQDKFLNGFNEIIPFASEHVRKNSQPDYARTMVFTGSVYSGLLHLNLIGREPNGLVSREQRGIVLSKLSKELKEIEEPDTGRSLFSNVYTSEEIYSGRALDHAPDLILDSYDSNWNIRMRKHIPVPEKARGKYFVDVANRRDFGWHSRDGMFVFCGEGFKPGRTEVALHVMDTPAALLNLYGVPIPEDYDGRVPDEVMMEGSHRKEINFQRGDDEGEWLEGEVLSEQESEELANHLRALGYLD